MRFPHIIHPSFNLNLQKRLGLSNSDNGKLLPLVTFVLDSTWRIKFSRTG